MTNVESEEQAYERLLQLPSGFFASILDQDDWSLIIKLHAVVESSLSHVLTETLGHKGLGDVFSRLDMSGAQTGKVAFGDALGCVTSSDKRFIRRLSELRNSLVHDVRSATFSLGDWVADRDVNQLKALALAVRRPTVPEQDSNATAQEVAAVKADPRRCFWVRTLDFVADSYHLVAEARTYHQQNEMLRLGSGVDYDDDD